ncbi:unnamed protein product [Leuciscus chuanchicus]
MFWRAFTCPATAILRSSSHERVCRELERSRCEIHTYQTWPDASASMTHAQDSHHNSRFRVTSRRRVQMQSKTVNNCCVETVSASDIMSANCPLDLRVPLEDHPTGTELIHIIQN